MRVKITEQRVEYQARTYEADVPDDADLDDTEAVRILLIDGFILDDETPWELVNASEDILSVEEVVA